jgi:[ribosomal protein S5]-alanine N-acetyltransferase
MFDIPLHTEHLILRPATLDLAKADIENQSRFAELLDAEIHPSWPPELYDDHARNWTLRALQNDPEGLITYYILLQRDGQKPILIGDAGFKGKLKNKIAEIGYSIVPERHGQGLGTEAVHALTLYSFQELNAEMVCAHTLPELIPSQRVLEKNGFVLRGTPAEKDAIRYEITRAEWNSRIKS